MRSFVHPIIELLAKKNRQVSVETCRFMCCHYEITISETRFGAMDLNIVRHFAVRCFLHRKNQEALFRGIDTGEEIKGQFRCLELTFDRKI